MIYLNSSKSREKWEEDYKVSSTEIIKWYPKAAKEIVSTIRIKKELETTKILSQADWTLPLNQLMSMNPKLLRIMRSLTVRDIGSSQFATFIEFGATLLERFESGVSMGKFNPQDLISRSCEVILNEIDESIVPWLKEKRSPTNEELLLAKTISTDRIIQRITSTALRYMHEPRQLSVLKKYLEEKGLKEVKKVIHDPRKEMENGTFIINATIQGLTDNSSTINLQIDALIKPFSDKVDVLPIFLEAKSLGDVVNPNKRQKEEANKVQNLRRKWKMNGEDLYFIILLGGTVPLRYLEIEASFGLDWVWEHRIADLDLLLDHY